MGGNSPSHLSQEDGEGGGVTFVKGIRVSEAQGGHAWTQVGESILTKGLMHNVITERPLKSARVFMFHFKSWLIAISLVM